MQEQQPTMRIDLGNGTAIYPKKGVDLKALGIKESSRPVRKRNAGQGDSTPPRGSN